MRHAIPADSISDKVAYTLRWLERHGSKKNRDGMARYGIVAPKVYGVSMTTMRTLAKNLGKNHELALALWDTGWHEARILSAFVDEPAHVTTRQMDAWARDFDNWAICDTICFHLFDKSPNAWQKIESWTKKKDEFVKRAGFALLAAVAAHDKKAPDAAFAKSLAIIEREAADDRNFVKKGASWALRTIGHRNRNLNKQSIDLAQKLCLSANSTERWIGKDALRDITRPMVLNRFTRD